MKPALRITLVITLFFCLYSCLLIFFVDPFLEKILIRFFPEEASDLLLDAGLVLVFTIFSFFVCYWLIRAYMAEQKKTEEIRSNWAAVTKSEENYKTLINRISEGFVSLDKNMVYTYVNENVLKNTGKTREEVIGKHIRDVYPEFMGAQSFQEMQTALSEQKYVYLTDHYPPTDTWQENHIYPSSDGVSVFIKDITEKRKTDLMLEKSEKRFRALIENSNDIITMMDGQGAIVYVSPAFLRLTGYTTKDVLGKSLFEFMPSDNVTVSTQKLHAILERPGLKMESTNRLRTKEGDYLLIEGVVSNLLHDENVRALVCNFRDVTEKKKSEEILKESEAHYRNLFENLLHGFAYFKVIYNQDLIDDYMFITVNQNYLDMTGFKEVEGKVISDVIPGIKQSNDKLYQSLSNVALSGKPESFEIYIEQLGKWYYVSLYTPKKDYIIALVDNITDAKKQDEQKSLFATIVTYSQDAIFSRNLDGVITSWNHSAEELFGYTGEEAIGMNANDLIPPESMKESNLALENLKKGVNIKHYETERIKKNGETVFVSLTISPILKDGEVTGASVIARDITDKKLAEEKIRYSENNLSAIIENATEAFILMGKDLRIKAFNKKAQQSSVLNYANSSIEQGSCIVDYIHPARKNFLLDTHAKVLKGETIQYENDYYSTPEKQQWYSTTFTPVWENGEVNSVCISIRDITSKKISQEKIIQSEENLRAIFDNALQAFILMDHEGLIKAFNTHAIKYVKVAYETEIKLGISILDIFDEKMKHFLKDIIQKTLQGETFQFSRAFETDRGKLVWLDFTISPVSRDNKVTGFCIVGNDITEKKTMEREREFDRKNLESLINNTSDLMWSVDQNRRLITYNKPFADLVLLSTGKPITKDTDLLTIQYDKKNERRFKGFYERALAGESFTEIMHNEEPGSRWSEISFYPIYNEQDVIGTACFLRDITERKKYEELLIRNAQEKETFIKELSQNNKDLQQFAYITSHNLRGPVASLMGLSNLLDNYTIEDKTLLQILDGIKKSTIRFDETIKDLNTILTVKDTPSVQRETIPFLSTFQKALDQCESMIKSCDAEIIYDFSKSKEIDFNKAYLESILLNLLSNALKYRDKHRRLKIRVNTELVNDRTVLRFKDNGIGIDTKLHKEKLFQLYQRFHQHLEGKGIGLFLIRSQLEAFDGSIEIKSEVNAGTEFIIHF